MLSLPRDSRYDVIGPRCPRCGEHCYVSLSAVIVCVSAECAWTCRPTMTLLGVAVGAPPPLAEPDPEE